MVNSAATVGPMLRGMTCVKLIGSGGFADVYLYEQQQPRMRVAVKLIKSDLLSDSKLRQFNAEANAMAELAEHPFIVPVLGAGTADDGRPYLVMRYYPSSDLAARVATNPMSVQEALRYGVQLSSAIETAHVAGIIHRDIKPSNILISSYGQPGLSDFGIAGRPNDPTDDDDDFGVSIPWSPREVLTGVSNGSVTSDVYSLAATIWNLLVGRAPFYVPGGDNKERATVNRIMHARPPVTGRDDVPASLDRLLQQAMSKDPDHRPQSALELARHFQRIEQELRLARTEVVVLDQAANVADAVRQAEQPSTKDAATQDNVSVATPVLPEADPQVEAPTSRRTPHRVESAQKQEGATVARSWSLPNATEPDTSKRVATGPVESESNASLQSAASVEEDQAGRPTQVRPRTVNATHPVEVPRSHDAQAPGRGRGRALVAIGGILVVVTVGVGMLLSRGGSHNGAGGHDPSTPADTSLGGVAPAPDTGPAAPSKVQGEIHGGRVTFSWPAVSGASGYSWAPDSGDGGQVHRPTVTVARAVQGSTCIRVSSLAVGLPTSQATRGCTR